MADRVEAPTGYVNLTSGAALVTGWAQDRLEVCGADRRRFLNGMLTCDVDALDPGDGCYGFATTSDGRVLADVVVRRFEDRFVLDLPVGSLATLEDHLGRYVVADRVELRRAEAAPEVVVAGPAASGMVAEIVGEEPAAWGLVVGGRSRAMSDLRLGVPAWRVQASAVGGEVPAPLLGLVGAAEEAVTAVRVERGCGWFGVDFGRHSFPQETGFAELAVSYSKGCYLGQEIVARIHYRGRVSRRLRGLSAPPGVRLAAGDELLLEAEVVGALTSAVHSPRCEGFVGLGMLHRKAEGAPEVSLGSGALLNVVELPFVERAF